MKIIFLILFILVSQAIFAQKFKKDYFSSPVRIPIYLTGNFGELRPNHFHSGIDIKTEGKTGLPVYAPADGFVSRINVSPSGFGLALYIDHPNGTTTVYGHLSKLREDMQQYIRTIQYQRESFAADVSVPKGKLVVKKNEIIAYTGNSGSSGGPHLHFEIRETASQHPLNPLNFHFSIKDDMKPQILAAMIYPLSADAHVAGKQKPQRIDAVFYQGEFHLKGNPVYSVYGKVGFAIQTLDYLNGSWSKCGVYQITLKIDGNKIYTFRLDELSFNETRYINSHIDYEYYQEHWQKFQKSWLDPGNKLQNYHDMVNHGIVDLSDGELHEVSYEIQDVYGNTSLLSFSVKSREMQIIRPTREGKPVYYNKTSAVSSNDFVAEFDPGTFYRDQLLNFSEAPSNNLYYSNIFKLHNTTIPVHQYFDLKIKPSSLPTALQDKALIVNIDPNNGRKYAQGGSYQNGWVKARVRTLGTFAVSVDTIPPVIQALSIQNKNKLTEANRIRFKISDDLSGIYQYRGEIDGQWVLFEYDAKNSLLEYYFDQDRFQFKQNHKLKLTVTDSKENESVYEAGFYR